MIRDDISLTSILIGFENVLCIDYSITDVHDLVEASINKLENMYAIKLDKPIYDVQIDNKYTNDSTTELINQITNNLKSLALLTTVSMFQNAFADTLRSVNYCGYEPNTLLNALKYLQDEEYYSTKDTFFEAIVLSMNKLELCPIKKLFIVLIILERLDMREGVAVLAQYLYIGGVMNG